MRRPLPWLAFAAVLLIPALAAADDGSTPTLTWAAYAGAFSVGIGTSFTPCVYPMIPITLAIFGARGESVSKRRALALATVYVLGMGLTYTVLGVVAAMIGKATAFGTQLTNPWIVFPLVALFLAMAASMFGAFDLALPSGLQAKLNQVGGKGWGGAFAMGMVGGLIAAPCTGPWLASLLGYISTTGDVLGGGTLMFVYALGMGVLFWVLAAAAGALPKSGPWMEHVKSAGGTALVFAAIYYLAPFTHIDQLGSAKPWLVVGSTVLAVIGLLLGAITLSFHGPARERIRKGVGVALVVVGAVGVWLWVITPKQRLPWVEDEKLAFERARVEHKGVMVDFSATWCNPCHELEGTFADDDVYATIVGNFVPLRFDVTDASDEHDQLKQRYGVVTLPGVVFVSADGTVLGRVKDFIKPGTMLDLLRPAVAKLAQ